MPGAEGIKAANYLYNIAPKDGTVIGGLQRNTGLTLFYHARQRRMPCSTPGNSSGSARLQQEIGFLLVRTATGVKSAADLKTNEVTTSSTTRNSPNSIYPRLAQRAVWLEAEEWSKATRARRRRSLR